DREYSVLLTELPLNRFRDLGVFLLYSLRIQGQLKRTAGLVGYSFAARIRERRFWTLSVWQNESALRQFVAEIPHRNIMAALQGKIGQTRFIPWKVRGSDYPPSWREAFERKNVAPNAPDPRSAEKTPSPSSPDPQ